MTIRRIAAVAAAFCFSLGLGSARADDAKNNTPPPGFKALFNGKDLSNFKGLLLGKYQNPIERAKLSKEQLATEQKKADESMREHWNVEDGVIVFDGKGRSLSTAKDYGDFEFYVDWKIKPKGDSGIYLRGTPQVQIWDPALRNIGSGGLFNNKNHPSNPLVLADNPVGEWNTFYIKMVGDRVTVKLNGKLVVDNVVLENYWDRNRPIFSSGPIELQNHGNTLYFRNIYIKELVKAGDAAKINEALPTTARAKPQKPRKVLAYTNAAGFVHSSIPYGAHAVEEMGDRTGAYETVISNNPAMFDPENLGQFDAVVLVNTTGNWLLPRNDVFKQLSQKQQEELKAREPYRQQSLIDFLSSGKGLAGFHSASDSQYQWSEFGKIIGGYFNHHPWHQQIRVHLEEPGHPLLSAFGGKDFEVADEIYQFKAPYSRDKLRVLLTLDTKSVDANKGAREDKDYAIAWIHTYGKGRVFYSSLGHREEIYWNPSVMQFYLDGIQYVLGDLQDIDAAPSAEAKR